MDSARPLTLFEILPKEDHHLIDGAMRRYRDEREVLGPLKAAQNFFAVFPTLASLKWSDADVAFAEARRDLVIQNATNKLTATRPTPLPNPVQQATNTRTLQEPPVQPATFNGSTKSAHVQEHAMIDQPTLPHQQSATDASSYPPSPSDSQSITAPPQKTPLAHTTIEGDDVHFLHDQLVAHKSSNPPSHLAPQRLNILQHGLGAKEHAPTQNYLKRYHAPSTPFYPSSSQKAIAQKGNNSFQSHALHTPSHPPEPTAAGHATPLEIPYLGKMCEICGDDFVWKKTATRCFKCLLNPPSDQKIAEIFLRAMRGVDSCSNCYAEADRGENMHCRDCHERQKLKTRRHAAKVKARRARQAAEAASAAVEGVAQLQLPQTHGVQPYGFQHHSVQHHTAQQHNVQHHNVQHHNVQHHNVQHHNVQHHGLEHHGPQHQGLQAPTDPAPAGISGGFHSS